MLTFPVTHIAAEPPVALLSSRDVPHPERAVARGDLVRVRPGIYAPATEWNSLRPWDRYLTRVHAVALLHPDAVFCHESAAALLGMPVLGDPVTVHVLVDAACAARESSGIRSHRAARLPDIVGADGLLMTSPGVTAVTLARHRHPALGLAAADAALRLDSHLTADAMRADNEGRESKRGRRAARWALSRANALRESVLESISDATREWLGFPAPELQRRFTAPDGTVDRGDFWWPDVSLIGEPDGEFKYDGRFGDPASLLRRRRDRDRRLLQGPAKAVVHWGWIDVARVWPLRDLLHGHGLPCVHPPNYAAIRSLMQLLAPYDRLLRQHRTPTR